MAEKIQFSFVGKLIKTFGYKGELIAHIENSFCKKITKTEFVFVEIQHERVPFFIMSIENQSGNIFSLMLEDTDNPEKAQSLNLWMKLVWKKWVKENPLGLNDSLLAMRSYAPYHNLYAVSLCFSSS